MKESKKPLLEKYILIDNYSDYVYGHLRKEDTLDELYSTGEFEKMLRKYSIADIKRKLKGCLDISRTSELAQRHPSLLNILDRFSNNKEWKETSLKAQYDILADKINKAISQISPSNWYKVDKIDLTNRSIRITVENDWRNFEIHYYYRDNRIGDCTIDIPSNVLYFYHETDNADQSTRELTSFSTKQNKSVMQVMSGVLYLYNNEHILEEICQALHIYEMEKERIEAIYEGKNDEITNDGTAILEAAARQAYNDGKLSV